MAAAAKVTQRQWDADAIEAMGPSAQASPWGSLKSVEAVLCGAHLFTIEHEGARVMLAVRGTEHEHGRLLEVVGARSLADRMPSAVLTAAIDHLAATCYERVDALAMSTRRDHIARAVLRAGWTETGRVFLKPLRLQ